MVQSFIQIDPILPLVLFVNLHISGSFFKIPLLIFYYIDEKLPCVSYFEQKVDDCYQKKRKTKSTCQE